MKIDRLYIDKEKLKETQRIVAESNILLDFYYSKITTLKGRQGYRTKQGDKNLTRAKYLAEIYSEYKNCCDSDVCLHGLVLPNHDVKKIVRTKELEFEIIQSLSGLIHQIVSKKKKIAKDLMLSEEDLEGECYKSIISALCSYKNLENCFSTYLHHCISKHINNLCNKTNHMSKLSRDAVELRRKYNQIKNGLLHNANFEEVVSLMNISEKETQLLKSSLFCKTVHFSEQDSIENIEIKTISVENNTDEGSYSLADMDKIRSEFTDLENAVLDGFISSSGKMGISSISKNIINPKTGKPYTRMAASLAWKKIKNKIKLYKGAA